MNDTPNDANTQRKRSGNHVAGIIALLALAVVVVAWFWTAREPAQDAFGVPHGVMVLGAGAFVVGLVAEIRSTSLWDVLELLWEAILGLFWLIGAVLKGLVSLVCGLFGWE